MHTYFVTPDEFLGDSDSDQLVRAETPQRAVELVIEHHGQTTQTQMIAEHETAAPDCWTVRQLPDAFGPGIVEWSDCKFTFWVVLY